ncbi:MAG: phosphate ABC transporter permease PstA [Nitrospirales bacterium]|nr:phosphate ABC transporter permease PstA [Nitrospira sp.]MDR4500011.1 phosphate ABC transporter permease PstA [Nitrospirales bacterium]
MPIVSPSPQRHDTFSAFIVWTVAGLFGAFFLWLTGDVLWHGFAHLSWNFFMQSPVDAGRQGGIGSILVSTGLILLVCMIVALPLGLATAVFLSEFTAYAHATSRYVQRSLDVLASVPSIVFGLFGNALFCQVLGLGFSILAGGLTLACMILPILIRTTEQGFRALPHEYRSSAAALGLTKRATILHVLLPGALPALIIGFVLGLGRAIAETAALIFTSGYVDRMPESLLDSGRTLSIHIYDLSMNVPGGDQAAYATALVLIFCLLIINGLSNRVSARWTDKRMHIA